MTNRAIRIWYLVHKWTSLICTAFMLMLCLTGLPLIFHEEIDHWIDGERPISEVPADAPFLSLDDATAKAMEIHPGTIPLYMSFDIDQPVLNVTTGPDAAATITDMVFTSLDRRTMEPVRSFDDDGVMHFLLQLHTDMFLGLPGELFLGLMGLLFFIAIISGIVVYAPFMRRLRFGTVRTSRSSRARWLDIHNLLGIATLMWASVVGLTGVVNTLSTPLVDLWRAQELRALVAPYRDQPVPDHREWASLQGAMDTALAAAPGSTPQFVAFPGVRFSSNYHYAVWLRGATPATELIYTPVLIDARTGDLTAISHMPWYMLALRLSQPLHFGDYGGQPMKILWAILDMIAIVILGSGLYLWLKKRGKATDTERFLQRRTAMLQPRAEAAE